MQHTIAVDLAKSVFQVAESSRPGRVNRPHRPDLGWSQAIAHAPATVDAPGRVSAGRNIAAVALANKTARIAWAVATQNRPFRP